jgi:hypothetical protein
MYNSIEVPSISNLAGSGLGRRNLDISVKGSPRLPQSYKKKIKDPFATKQAIDKPMNRIENMQDITTDLFRPEN